MKKLIVALGCFFSFACPAASAPRLVLLSQNGFLYVLIVNHTDRVQRFTRSFTSNPAFGVLRLNVRSQGHLHGLVSPPNEDFATASSYIALHPAQTFGKAYVVSEITREYGIRTSCFLVQAVYHDPKGSENNAFDGELVSSELKICN